MRKKRRKMVRNNSRIRQTFRDIRRKAEEEEEEEKEQKQDQRVTEEEKQLDEYEE